MKRLTLVSASVALAVSLVYGGPAWAGSVFLTGHDVDFHGNQNGFSTVILNFLRGAGTPSEIPAADYHVGALRDPGGTFNSPPGFPVVIRDPASFATPAEFAEFLATIRVLEIASHSSCGGCALSTAGSNLINGFRDQITDFFNAGGDIWANTGGSLATYYDFLPPGAVATGAPISGSFGFVATAEGVAIGIQNNMINGFATHNRFTAFDPVFTVFEIRPFGGVDEVISIGVRDAAIVDDVIVVPPPDGPPSVPEPGVLSLLGLGVAGLSLMRRRGNR